MSITIALAGNPNSGKTTLFNALTGSNQYVGNWPGVTVERKEARFDLKGEEATLVDLPGVYSLSPYSIEENITRHFIAQHAPDVVLNIVDATNIERNLYLTLQLMELERPVVIALNLMDELERRGIHPDCQALSRLLGAPVVPISAKKGQGFEALFEAIYHQAKHPVIAYMVRRYDESTRRALEEIVSALGGSDSHSAFDLDEHREHRDEVERDDDHSAQAQHRHIGGYEDEGDEDFAPPTTWVAVKLLEGDEEIKASAQLSEAQRSRIRAAIDAYVERGREKHPGIDSLTLMVDARYAAIEKALNESGFPRQREHETTVSDKIDRVLTHRVFAFPIFFAVLALMFALTFGWPGTALSDLVEQGIGLLSEGVSAALSSAPAWIRALLVDGVLAGVGGVLVFLPQILIIFLFMSILEDSGYMSRAAFITDRLLRRFGLSGRSFIPMLMGFGCTTTAVIAARGVENERDRRMTILLTPFMSCGAKLPVYGLITAAIFPGNSALVVLSLYLLGILLMVVAGLVLRKTTFREGETPFVMELPAYRVPSVKNVARRLWDRAKDFIVRAGTIIFAMSVVVWFLQSFSPSLQMVTDPAQSMFGRLGAFIAPIFAPLGFGEWQKSVSLLSGLVAKEAVVSTMQVLYAAGSTAQLGTLLVTKFTPLSAYAYLVFILLYTPCVSAVAAIRRETGSWKYTLLSVLMQLGVAYVMALLVFQIGSLLGA